MAVWLFWGATGMLKAAGDHLLDRAAPEGDRQAITKAVLPNTPETLEQLETYYGSSYAESIYTPTR